MPSYKVLVSFSAAEDLTFGARPLGGLIIDANGNLFGTTAEAGPNNGGTVFEIIQTNGTYATSPTTLVGLTDTFDEGPRSGLVVDLEGNLIGTTFIPGTGFEVAKIANGYASSTTTLTNFSFIFGGTQPTGSLTADAAGDLFGTTTSGGIQNTPALNGTVYEIPKVGPGYGTPAIVAAFSLSGANTPYGSVLLDSAGDIFGTTSAGGLPGNGDGTVFEIPKTAGGFGSPLTLATFDNTTGADPRAGLVADAAGDLFGTTQGGGTNSAGTVFEIPKTANGYGSLVTLVNFNGSDGAGPSAPLIVDAVGDLFGTTSSGGTEAGGTVFEVPKVNGSYAITPTTLANMAFATGDQSEAGLLADSAGNLFGTASNGAGGVGAVFEITNSGFQVPCFLRGTRILTPHGEVAVEDLAVGDVVHTELLGSAPIRWIGSGCALATRGRRNAATPVIIRKSALADNVPHRDLRITKGHSLYIEGVLIPVEFLVNHRSILWDDHAQEVSIYHIELETHDVLLASGAPAESYRDDGNRWLFHNANGDWDLPPQLPCAPVLTGGPVVDEIWRRLLDRASAGKPPPLTGDADVHLVVDGRRLDAAERVGEAHIFHLRAVPLELRVVSRAAAPAELGLARDPRVLGVALRYLVARQGTRFRMIEARDARWTDGFHAFEADNGFRWTDGDAAIPAELYAGFKAPLEVILRVGATTSYRADAAVQRVA